MAQFAPVAPIQILEGLQDAEALGGYHLLLTHHVLEAKERFIDLFKNTRYTTVIMDNSLVELGDAENDSLVFEATQALRETSTCQVIPVIADVMGSGVETRRVATTSYQWWQTTAPEIDTMVVLQGSDWDDFCKSVDYFLASSEFSFQYVGIPRILTDKIGSRQQAIKYVNAIAPHVNIHLLGFSNNVVDDIICSQSPDVMGIDTAVPLRYSFSVDGGKYTPTSEIPPRPANWFEAGQLDEATLINLANIRKWVA